MTMGESFTTNTTCGGIASGTSISSSDKISDIVKDMVYEPELPAPPTEYASVSLGTWSTKANVDDFFNTYTPENGWSGLKLGNYVTIQDGTYNVNWEIAGFNLEHKQTAADGTVYDNGYGICMIPKTSLDQVQWFNTSGGVDSSAAAVNPIPYRASYIHTTYLTNTVSKRLLKSIIGSHMVNRNVLLGSGQNGSTYTSGNLWYNQTSAYTWDTAYLTLMSVGQFNNTFGSYDTKYDDGEANYYLPLFDNESYGVSTWLRNLRGSSSLYDNFATACIALGNKGNQISGSTKISNGGVRPLMYMR